MCIKRKLSWNGKTSAWHFPQTKGAFMNQSPGEPHHPWWTVDGRSHLEIFFAILEMNPSYQKDFFGSHGIYGLHFEYRVNPFCNRMMIARCWWDVGGNPLKTYNFMMFLSRFFGAPNASESLDFYWVRAAIKPRWSNILLMVQNSGHLGCKKKTVVHNGISATRPQLVFSPDFSEASTVSEIQFTD